MTSLLHISPQLPPAICGVGDYATLVGERIEQLYPDVRCGYVAAGHVAQSVAQSAAPSTVIPVTKSSGHAIVVPRGTKAVSLWDALVAERDRLTPDHLTTGPLTPAVVLHYSGYGYSPDGAPAWLADALENRPADWQGARVVTFFHELYATGWPWRRAFWQSARQRRIAERIARASDAVMTNREQSARWLETVTGRPTGSVPHLPVPSNVGEPESVPVYEDRPPHAVVFGGAGHKRKFLTGRGARRTAQTCQDLGLTRLTDIGAPTPVDRRPFDQAGVEVVQTGYLPKEAIGELLFNARVGFCAHACADWSKSGVAGAYEAYGVRPLSPTCPAQADTAMRQLDRSAEKGRPEAGSCRRRVSDHACQFLRMTSPAILEGHFAEA